MASDTSPGPSPQKPKTVSRKKKSASQTEVLERAYAVEKYPSEATRSALGRDLGLSDKQLQIWFTHRRYKDRRDGIDDEKLTFYAKNKTATVDTSTLECRSSKKAELETHAMDDDDDYDNESEPDGYPARVLAEEQDDDDLIADDHDHDHDANGMDSSYEKTKPGPRRRLPKDLNRVPQRPGPKPKINAMAIAERAAIAAVEIQLCGPLREDGPPLGFDFDPLPPRAFADLPITEPALNTAGVSREGGSENFSERQSKWAKDTELAEKRKSTGGPFKPSRSEIGY